MRIIALTLTAFTLLATSASAAQVGTATGVAAPNTAGARPAGLTISLRLPLHCGKPGPSAIVITLPRAWRVPKRVARIAAWIDGSHPRALTVSGHTLTLQPVSSSGTCTVIAPGSIRVKLTQAAKLGNPRKAGRYTVHASVGMQKFGARVSIRS